MKLTRRMKTTFADLARLAAIGIAIRLVSFIAARLIGSFLYGVRPTDPVSLFC